ncbi:sugar ABC transporter substrate-binding protein [Actinocatenispora thailandica]|uniref:Sugar ABC transporter substrate-binding protein n=1 Tax=Actinocatenispora thailandica TaxID=227318 RepID=A0A7R7DPQ6_9ACTN|nr:sugar ABC transporter substrate-binding protein [Actinocatenispora thailandica]BCJ35487.1 sugar ABC transporter substrate-binding protein [Actinocatenispora thailandica]
MLHARRHWAGALLLALVLAAVAGCSNRVDSGATAAPTATPQSRGGNHALRVAVVTHGAAGDPFWAVVKNGAVQAGKDLHVRVSYQGSGVPQTQAQFIDAAVNQHVDGLVVSMANPDALKASIRRAVGQGIPVVTINSGEAQSAAFGAITHVGQDESVAGEAAGARLAKSGAHHVLCVIHEAGNIGLTQRCQGAAKGLSGKLDTLQVNINNLAQVQATIRAKLTADHSIDGVLALNPAVAMAAVSAESGTGSTAKIATFDLSGDVTSAIEQGRVLFAVDQQPYLQGYLPVQLIKLYHDNDNTLGGGKPVLTGPGFVTKDNAAKVAQLAKEGTR